MNSVIPVIWTCKYCSGDILLDGSACVCEFCHAWVCTACTYVNNPDQSSCEMCGGVKKEEQNERELTPPLPAKRNRSPAVLGVPRSHNVVTPSPDRSKKKGQEVQRSRSGSPQPRRKTSEDTRSSDDKEKECQIDRNKSRYIKYTPPTITKPGKPKENMPDNETSKDSNKPMTEKDRVPKPVGRHGDEYRNRKLSPELNGEEQSQADAGNQLKNKQRRDRKCIKKRASHMADIQEGKEVSQTDPTEPRRHRDESREESNRKSKIDLEDYGWNCKLCTYLNNQGRLKCDMCLTPKPDLSQRSLRQRLTRKRQLKMGSKSIKIKDREKKEEQEAKEKWIKIVQFCKENKINFVDDSFKPCDESLYGPSHHRHDNTIRWLRCQDIKSGQRSEDTGTWTVMRGNPLPEDIEQGELGNCWFLSALAVLAERRDLLEKIILTKSFCEEGVYQVRLCKDGRWKIVLIDDLFPCNQYNMFKYSRARRKQLWVPIIEKAAAKLHGSYRALESGLTTEALALLTGQPCERIELQVKENGKRNIKLDVVWEQLLLFRNLGFLMGASCDLDKSLGEKHYEEMGLVPYHAYSLLDVQDVQGNKLVRLRNPWGKKSWTGPWCDHSPQWKSISGSVKEKLKLDCNDKGIFWMELTHFQRYYSSVSVCKAHKDWSELRVKGTFPPHGLLPWKFVTFTALQSCELNLGLFQKSFRGEGDTKDAYVDLLIVVLENNQEDKPALYKRVVGNSHRSAKAFTGCDISVKHGMYTVACLAFKHWKTDCAFITEDDIDKLNKEFVLSIHSSDFIISDEVDTAHPRYKYALADTVIQLALDRGQKAEYKDGMVIYDLFWYGVISVIENQSSKLYAHIKVDCSEGSFQYPTRGSLVTVDSIPPKHRQVVLVLTPYDSKSGWSTNKRISYISTKDPDLLMFDLPRKHHDPDITKELEPLHSPRPIQ